MTHKNDEFLIEHLVKQGLTQAEIERVLAKLQDYDKQTFHASVFDSIERGTFDLESIIAEVRSSGKTRADNQEH